MVEPMILERKDTSSIELQRSAKGDYYWTIKLYFDGVGVGEASGCLAQIVKIDAFLREKFLEAAA